MCVAYTQSFGKDPATLYEMRYYTFQPVRWGCHYDELDTVSSEKLGYANFSSRKVIMPTYPIF